MNATLCDLTLGNVVLSILTPSLRMLRFIFTHFPHSLRWFCDNLNKGNRFIDEYASKLDRISKSSSLKETLKANRKKEKLVSHIINLKEKELFNI